MNQVSMSLLRFLPLRLIQRPFLQRAFVPTPRACLPMWHHTRRFLSGRAPQPATRARPPELSRAMPLHSRETELDKQARMLFGKVEAISAAVVTHPCSWTRTDQAM